MTAANDNLQRVYREVSRQLLLRGEISGCALFAATMDALGQAEEKCAREIIHAVAIQIRAGLVDCNTATADGHVILGAETILTPRTEVMQ